MERITLTILLGAIALLFGAGHTPAQAPDGNAAKKQKSAATKTLKPRKLTKAERWEKEALEKEILLGKNLHEGPTELAAYGDINSVPVIIQVLKKYPPNERGVMICTASHALGALYKLTGANPGIRYEDWKAWWEKHEKNRQRPK